MLGFLGLLLVVWLALIVIGAVIKGLFWLIIIGADPLPGDVGVRRPPRPRAVGASPGLGC